MENGSQDEDLGGANGELLELVWKELWVDRVDAAHGCRVYLLNLMLISYEEVENLKRP